MNLTNRPAKNTNGQHKVMTGEDFRFFLRCPFTPNVRNAILTIISCACRNLGCFCATCSTSTALQPKTCELPARCPVESCWCPVEILSCWCPAGFLYLSLLLPHPPSPFLPASIARVPAALARPMLACWRLVFISPRQSRCIKYRLMHPTTSLARLASWSRSN